MVKYLIKKGADIKRKGIIRIPKYQIGHLLGIALVKNNLKMLKFFIEECGIDVNDKEVTLDNYNVMKDNWDAMEYAIREKNKEVTTYLINHGGNADLYDLLNILDENIFVSYIKKQTCLVIH
jgi:hypothetical protein